MCDALIKTSEMLAELIPNKKESKKIEQTLSEKMQDELEPIIHNEE